MREVQVLKLLARGFTTSQLARELHRSPRTVDHHVSAILGKLGVHSRSQAVAAAFTLGIASVHDASPLVTLGAGRAAVNMNGRTRVTQEFLANKVDMLSQYVHLLRMRAGHLA